MTADEHERTGERPPTGRPEFDRVATARVGRFELLARLGQGGMGVVYRARDPNLDREVAIKLLNPELTADASAQRRFRREALAMSGIDHPGLCPVYEVDEFDGQPYFVMPLLGGETLAVRIARERDAGVLGDRARVDAVVALTERIARALDHAHRAGIVHRDIKPANILLQSGDEPVVLDFGLARDASDAGGEAVEPGGGGTPLYMAPEQIASSGEQADRRADIYSLGITLFEALTLSPPFSGRSLFELFVQIRDRPTPDPGARNAAVPSDLRVVVAVATEKAASRRYATCAEFADDLRRVLRGEPVRARPLPVAVHVLRWLRRNPVAMIVLGSLVAGILASAHLWRANAVLADDLGRLVDSERRLRDEAEAMHRVAEERLDRFELLALESRLDGMRDEVAGLLPPWPDNAAPLRRWLDRVDVELRPTIRRVDVALEQLRAEAIGEAPRIGDEEPTRHQSCLPLLIEKREALRFAAEVRRGDRRFEPLPPVLDTDLRHLGGAAHMPLGTFGREREALAFVTGLVERGIGAPHATLILQGWAFHGVGLDDQAHATIRRAIAIAPASHRIDLEWEANFLARSCREAPAALAAVEELVAQLEPIATAPRDLAFSEDSDRVLHDALVRVRGELFDLTRDDMLVSRVREYAAWSAAIGELSAEHPNARVSWDEARAAIAAADGVGASELYAATPVALQPQMGLVPIGMNPRTKLWEFYHLRSAIERWDPAAAERLEIPRHDPDGRIGIGSSTGIVFVLVPGGATTIGDPGPRSGAAMNDRLRENENHMSGHVEPYLLARHELTQGQWLRLLGARDPLSRERRNPSHYGDGRIYLRHWHSRRHPVESVSWQEATELLRTHGLELPSEWQWEHACRAGTDTQYWWGDRPEDAYGVENVLDPAAQSFLNAGSRSGFDDGYTVHAPVGSFKPNAFGFFDMLGNVGELCRNPSVALTDVYSCRGGTYAATLDRCRSSARGVAYPGTRNRLIGLRASRPLR